MTILRSRSAAALASAAVLSLLATPAVARDWGRHHDDGIDAGDVFAGLLIVGGIAAIAAAASNKAKKDRQAREDARYRDDYRQDARGDYRADDNRGAPSADYGGSRAAVTVPEDYGDTRREPPPADYGADRADGQAIDYGNMARDDAARDEPAAPARSAYGVDAAVDACVGEVERGNRNVENIDGVNREGQGWRVGGRVAGGYGFSCLVDGKGRVKSVEGL